MIAYKGNPMQRRALQGELRMNQFQVLLTTYEYIIKDRPHLSKIKWVHMIIGKLSPQSCFLQYADIRAHR